MDKSGDSKNTSKNKEEILESSRLDYFWGFMFVIFAVVFGIAGSKLNDDVATMHSLYKAEFEQANQSTSYDWPRFSDFWISCVVGVIEYWLLEAYIILTYKPFYYRFCREQKDDNMRCRKALKATHRGFAFWYSLFISIWGYMLLSQTDFLPPMMLG